MNAIPERQRRRIRWRRWWWILPLFVLIVLPPIILVTSTFLSHWNAPYGDWFVDANGQPVAGACEAAQLPARAGIERASIRENHISAEDALKIGDRLVMATFALDAPPQTAIPMLAAFNSGLYYQVQWVYVAALPIDPASDALLSEAVPRQKAFIVQIDAVTRSVIDMIAVPDAAPIETCRREFRAVVRTIVNEWRDRTFLLNFLATWGYYLIILTTIIVTPILVYRGLRALRR